VFSNEGFAVVSYAGARNKKRWRQMKIPGRVLLKT